MIVQCDKCKAKFQLADEKVTPKGVKVRCSKCENIFTVKKDDQIKSALPEEKNGAPTVTDEDPFSDFSFSDDLDFGEESEDFAIGAPGEKEQPEAGGGFLDEEPSVSEPEPPEDAGFEFSDEEFAFDDEPAPAAPPKPEKKPGPAAPGPGPEPKGPEEFGDFSFGDESFSETPEAAEGPPSAGGGVDEWGNVSVSDVQEEVEAPAGADVEEAGFGDFQFDEAAEEEDDSMEVDDFVRPSGPSPSRGDGLEADIGDSEPMPRREFDKETPPPPPKPVIKTTSAKSNGKAWLVIIVILVLLVGGLASGVAYTQSKGWFGFSDLFSGDWKKLGNVPALHDFFVSKGWIEPPPEGKVEVAKSSHKVVTREDGSVIVVVTGQVVNNTNKSQSRIKIQAELKDKDTGQVVAAASGFCGVSFTDQELENKSKTEIKDIMTTSGGRDFQCIDVKPGESRDFAIVFFDFPPGNLKLVSPRVVEYATIE